MEHEETRFDDAVVAGVTGHMNGDHGQDNLDIVRAFGAPAATAARQRLGLPPVGEH